MPVKKAMLNAEIGLGEFVDLLEKSSLTESIDLGLAVIHDVDHPVFGRLILVNTSEGRSVVMKL